MIAIKQKKGETMKRLFVAIFVMLLFAGCAKKEKPAIAIGPITITAAEFEQAYQKSKISRSGTLSRKEFLDVLVTRKLILQEAEELGLDKDPQFLDSLQIFWEQALFKLVLARKLNELSLSGKISEKEISDYYFRHKDSDFQGKELAEVHDQIRMLLFRIKQQLQLQNWTKALKKNAKVSIDYGLLQIPEGK
jgi:hypothetical protein